jgi:hypothetical protein
MRKILKSLFLLSVLLIIFTCLPALVQAQIIDPNCDPLDPLCPIDSGLILLLATGAFYGIYKLRNIKQLSTPQV